LAKSKKYVRIRHKDTGLLLAEGPLGWGITPFEGNFYIARKYIKTDRFRINLVPGLCVYKFLYVWLDLYADTDRQVRNLAWLYWLPNPMLPFIWFRIALPGKHPEIQIEEC
jgi:uncharacterized protein (DUF427 family)